MVLAGRYSRRATKKRSYVSITLDWKERFFLQRAYTTAGCILGMGQMDYFSSLVFLSICLLPVEEEQRTREMIEIPWVAILKSIAEEAVIL